MSLSAQLSRALSNHTLLCHDHARALHGATSIETRHPATYSINNIRGSGEERLACGVGQHQDGHGTDY